MLITTDHRLPWTVKLADISIPVLNIVVIICKFDFKWTLTNYDVWKGCRSCKRNRENYFKTLLCCLIFYNTYWLRKVDLLSSRPPFIDVIIFSFITFLTHLFIYLFLFFIYYFIFIFFFIYSNIFHHDNLISMSCFTSRSWYIAKNSTNSIITMIKWLYFQISCNWFKMHKKTSWNQTLFYS